MNDSKLVVFDLDNTLLTINSHYYFAEFFFKQRSKLLYYLYSLITTKIAWRILTRILRKDIRRVVSVLFFSFYKKAELEKAASDIFEKHSESLFNEKILRLFKHFQNRDEYRVVILTATPDFIAKAFEGLLDVEVLASRYSNGRLTFDMTGKKLEEICKNFREKQYLFVSDNEEDINSMFEHYILVKHNDMYIRRDTEDMISCL